MKSRLRVLAISVLCSMFIMACGAEDNFSYDENDTAVVEVNVSTESVEMVEESTV